MLKIITEWLGRLWVNELAKFLIVIGHFIEDFQVPGNHLLKIFEIYAQVFESRIFRVRI
jgi:hypothetical protein